MSGEQIPKSYLVPGRDGEIRRVDESEMSMRDELLRQPYTGNPLEVGEVVRQAGYPNPPFTGIEEMFLDNK